MKPAQVNKLYAKLTPHEQAALAVEAASRHDESAIDAILAHVERTPRSCNTGGYRYIP